MVKAQDEAKASKNAPTEELAEQAETLSEEIQQQVPLSAGMILVRKLTWGWLESRCWSSCPGCFSWHALPAGHQEPEAIVCGAW